MEGEERSSSNRRCRAARASLPRQDILRLELVLDGNFG